MSETLEEMQERHKAESDQEWAEFGKLSRKAAFFVYLIGFAFGFGTAAFLYMLCQMK